MATVTRSLSSSGNSPDLHQACAKAATAWVRYSVDADTSVADAGEILKEVSRPLVDLLAGGFPLAHCVLSLYQGEWYCCSLCGNSD